MEAQVYRENSSLPSPSRLRVRTSAISCFQKVLTVTNEWNLWSALTFLVNGHIMLNAPVLVRSPKLSSIEPRQYLDGWPPGNTGCCWHINFFFSIFYAQFLTRKVVLTWWKKFTIQLFLSKSQYRTWFFFFKWDGKATQDMTTPYYFKIQFLDLLWSGKKELHFQRSRANSKLSEDQPDTHLDI